MQPLDWRIINLEFCSQPHFISDTAVWWRWSASLCCSSPPCWPLLVTQRGKIRHFLSTSLNNQAMIAQSYSMYISPWSRIHTPYIYLDSILNSFLLPFLYFFLYDSFSFTVLFQNSPLYGSLSNLYPCWTLPWVLPHHAGLCHVRWVQLHLCVKGIMVKAI